VLTNETHDRLLALAVQIVIAHIGHNNTPIQVLPDLIRDIYNALASIAPPPTVADPHRGHDHGHAAPRAADDHIVSDDRLICLEDGLSMKMLKRHLLTVHGLTPDQYRAKWGLPADYPMVAANYAKLRSSLARESGLGLRPEARLKRRRT
jgi:predicted transcriptional regulator